MVSKQSTMQELGLSAPEFTLPDATQNMTLISKQQYTSQPLLVMFICNHCPYVIRIMQPLVDLASEFVAKGFAVVAINSNDVVFYPQDSPEKMQEFATNYGFIFPYCFDETQQVAKAYGAACTPDFFVYDAEHQLRYRGQFDQARPSNDHDVTGDELRQAMQSVLDGTPVSEEQTPSMGCNIKWRVGNEPDYF